MCVNLVNLLHPKLKGGPCQIFSKHTKVRSGLVLGSRRDTKGLFSYPDLLVVCGEMQFHDKYRDGLLTPTVIIEVLSPPTEAFDRGEKFWRYRTYLASLKDYLMVSQTMPMIEHYVHRSSEWILTRTVIDLEATVQFFSIDCSLRLADVYDRITFSQEAPRASRRRSVPKFIRFKVSDE